MFCFSGRREEKFHRARPFPHPGHSRRRKLFKRALVHSSPCLPEGEAPPNHLNREMRCFLTAHPKMPPPCGLQTNKVTTDATRCLTHIPRDRGWSRQVGFILLLWRSAGREGTKGKRSSIQRKLSPLLAISCLVIVFLPCPVHAGPPPPFLCLV